MIIIHAKSTRRETAIEHLVSLKSEVLRYLNGEPTFSYPQFYAHYAEARAYFSAEEAALPEIRQAVARLPELAKPTLFFINVRKLKQDCASGALRAYLYGSAILVASPVTLPLMLLQTYRDRKIKTQLNTLYNTLERLLWKLVTE
jgi:hypothetical protein